MLDAYFFFAAGFLAGAAFAAFGAAGFFAGAAFFGAAAFAGFAAAFAGFAAVVFFVGGIRLSSIEAHRIGARVTIHERKNLQAGP